MARIYRVLTRICAALCLVFVIMHFNDYTYAAKQFVHDQITDLQIAWFSGN